VIYLALEEKRSEVRKHFQDMGATGEEEIYVFAASAPVDALQQVRAVIEEKKPVLLIIDPLFRFTRVKDGNDYAQVTAALEPLLVLARETGVHVLCVHHAGKMERDGGDSILGSTALFAAVDTALMMKRSERYRTIASVQRYGEDLPETVLRFDSATRTVTLGESKEKEEEQRISEAIVEFLEAKQAPTEERDIQEEIEGRKAVKVHALRSLLESGKIYRQRKNPDLNNRRGNPYLYALDVHWFISSQYISGNLGTNEKKADLSPQETSDFIGSRPSAEPQKNFIGSRDSAKTPEPTSTAEKPVFYKSTEEL
jgi:predicted ATP-dependent serine protease